MEARFDDDRYDNAPRSQPPSCAFALLVATASVGAATIKGTGGNDTLRGGTAADRLDGKGGNDKLYGAAGNDVLLGGAGNDVLVGGPGSDRLTCGAGRDTARGDAQDKARSGLRGRTGDSDDPAPSAASHSTASVASPAAAGHSGDRPARTRVRYNQGNFLFFDGVCRSHLHRVASQRSSGRVRRRRLSPRGRGLRRQQVPDHGRRHVRRRRNLGRLDRPGRRRVHALGRPSRWTLRHGNVRERDDRHELRAALPGHGAPLFVRRDQMDGNAPLMS